MSYSAGDRVSITLAHEGDVTTRTCWVVTERFEWAVGQAIRGVLETHMQYEGDPLLTLAWGIWDEEDDDADAEKLKDAAAAYILAVTGQEPL